MSYLKYARKLVEDGRRWGNTGAVRHGSWERLSPGYQDLANALEAALDREEGLREALQEASIALDDAGCQVEASRAHRAANQLQ